MKTLLTFFMCFTAVAQAAEVNSDASEFDKSVVMLSASRVASDMDSPWLMQNSEVTGYLGVVVGANRVLAPAALVSKTTYVEAQILGESERVPMGIVHVDFEIGLALLEAVDGKALAALKPIKMGEDIPLLSEGWILKSQGSQLLRKPVRVTELMFNDLPTSSFSAPTYMASTQQKGLGRGEPFVRAGALVGLCVFQQDDDDVVILPVSIVQHFLRDEPGERYRGFPWLGVQLGDTASPDLRKSLHVNGQKGGQRVVEVHGTGSLSNQVHLDDVILSLDGIPISDRGLVKFSPWGQVHFRTLLMRKYAGDNIELKVWRNKELLTINATLKRYDSKAFLVADGRHESLEPHLIFGGLLFEELSTDYFAAWGKDWAKRGPLDMLQIYFYENNPSADKRRKLVMNRVLADAFNQGYENLQNLILVSVNGQTVNSLEELGQTLRRRPVQKAGKSFAVFTFASGDGEVILPYKGLEAAHDRIARAYSVHTPTSFWLKNDGVSLVPEAKPAVFPGE